MARRILSLGRAALRAFFASALLGGASCSLLVESSDIDSGCGVERKLCGTGHCVAQNDPAYGCSLDHCEPCELTNAIPACEGQTCVVKACLLGFGCPNDTGCTTNVLLDSDNCGTCGNTCAAAQSCDDGQCVEAQDAAGGGS